MKKFIAQQNTNLKSFTDATYPQGGFAFSALLKKGDIKLNGVRVRANCDIAVGDEVTYYTTPSQEAKPSHKIVFEDGNIMIADKLSGVNSEALFCELGGEYMPVNRLDRNTCGLIVFAKTGRAYDILEAAFKDRTVKKIYHCLAKNNFKKQADTLEGYLLKDEKKSEVKILNKPCEGAQRIVTEYKLLNSFGDYALVEITLHTGRTHQIRAHLAHIGCPVLGDTKYGEKTLNEKYHIKRQILVSKYLSFTLTGDMEYLNGKLFESSFNAVLPQ